MPTRQASRALAKKPVVHVNLTLTSIMEEDLRKWVDRLAVPRHYELEHEENKNTALWIAAQFQSWGYQVQLQGPWWNVVALAKEVSGPLVLVCVPELPAEKICIKEGLAITLASYAAASPP